MMTVLLLVPDSENVAGNEAMTGSGVTVSVFMVNKGVGVCGGGAQRFQCVAIAVCKETRRRSVVGKEEEAIVVLEEGFFSFEVCLEKRREWGESEGKEKETTRYGGETVGVTTVHTCKVIKRRKCQRAFVLVCVS